MMVAWSGDSGSGVTWRNGRLWNTLEVKLTSRLWFDVGKWGRRRCLERFWGFCLLQRHGFSAHSLTLGSLEELHFKGVELDRWTCSLKCSLGGEIGLLCRQWVIWVWTQRRGLGRRQIFGIVNPDRVADVGVIASGSGSQLLPHVGITWALKNSPRPSPRHEILI